MKGYKSKISRMTSEVSGFSTATRPWDHLSPGLFYRITRCSRTTCLLTEPITDGPRPVFRLIGPNKKEGDRHRVLSLNGLPMENDFKHYRSVSAWCDQFRSKMSYPAADKCETHSNRMINDSGAQLHVQYAALEWNCRINPLHLNPECQTELFSNSFQLTANQPFAQHH